MEIKEKKEVGIVGTVVEINIIEAMVLRDRVSIVGKLEDKARESETDLGDEYRIKRALNSLSSDEKIEMFNVLVDLKNFVEKITGNVMTTESALKSLFHDGEAK